MSKGNDSLGVHQFPNQEPISSFPLSFTSPVMDSSKHFQETEGCSSSESGWTMYIGSPMDEEDAQGSDDNDKKNAYITNTQNGGAAASAAVVDEDDSDDSMVSDASSGPSHREQMHEKGGCNQSVVRSKQDKGDNSKCSSHKKPNKQEKKRGENNSSRKQMNGKVQGK